MRKLASLQIINNVTNVPNSDNLDVAQVLGWNCVTKRGEYKKGQLIVYVEIDSVLPERQEFEFLRNKKFRIKTIRLRGQVSQGIIFPLQILSNDKYDLKLGCITNKETSKEAVGLKEGVDVTEILGITQYVAVMPARLSGIVKGLFPVFLHKTDETRIQSEPEVLNRHKGKHFFVTEKIDGSSMSCFINNKEFGVCSRNMELRETEKNAFWRVARDLDIEKKLMSLNKNIAIQGELYGNGIQKNKYKIKGLSLAIFNIFDIDKHKYLDFKEFILTCDKLNMQHVPVIYNNFKLNHSVNELVSESVGFSKLNSEARREGIIFRTLNEERDNDLGRLSFKVINPEFLLKNKD